MRHPTAVSFAPTARRPTGCSASAVNSQFAAAPAVSVIVTTYNRPDALAAVLRGLGRQTGPAFEVIVADDGSTQETADFLRREQSAVGFPLRHVWQEDEGFRAARA